MIGVDSISLATNLVESILREVPEDKRPVDETRKIIVARIAAAMEANVLTLGDKVLLDPELRSLKAASDIVKKVFRDGTGWAPTGYILPSVFEQRCPLPEIAAEYGMPIPRRKHPSKEAVAVYDELIENPDVSREYERKAILAPEYPFDVSEPQHLVAIKVGNPNRKFDMLDAALDNSCFFEHLERAWKRSGKSKEDFSIILKAHFIPLIRRDEVGVYTDPTLVIHVVRRIMERGWRNVSVAEGRNSFGKWYDGRGVVRVAARAGYVEEEAVEPVGKSPSRLTGYVDVKGELLPFTIVDLSHQLVSHEFTHELLGRHFVSQFWRDADYRITFGKLKTHYATRYALNLANISLALPMEDRLVTYPTEMDEARAVTALMEAFPVHFSLIDGITAADGVLGYVRRPRSRVPGIIIAGQNIFATENLGAQLMGVDPFESVLTRLAATRLGGMMPYKLIGNPVLLKPWKNVRSALVGAVTALMEKFPTWAEYWLPMVVGNPDPCFPPKGDAHSIKRRRRLAWLLGARPIGVWLTRRDGLITAFKKRRLRSRVKKKALKMPLSAGYPEFFEEARHLNLDEMEALVNILNESGNSIYRGEKEVVRAGHVIIVGDRKYPFAGPDALSAISVGRILTGVAQGKWTAAQVISEMEKWRLLRTSWWDKLKLFTRDRLKLKGKST